MREAPIRQQMRDRRQLKGFAFRTLTALGIGVVLISADLWGGTIGWAAVVAVLAAMCATEFYRMTRSEHRRANEVFGVFASAMMPLAVALYANTANPPSSEIGAIGLTAVMGGLVLAAILWNLAFRQVRGADTSTTVFGAVYVGFTLSHLVLIHALDSGAEFVLVILFGVWAMDVFAYLVGSAIGRHRLAPHISPKKSWEGFIAGSVGTIVMWIAGWYIIQPAALPLWWFVVTGVVAAVAALLGDLAESRLKREVGAKDSGTLLPGHGGFLDRFDSLIMVSVVAYYMLLFGINLFGGPR
jgi:phosphatidate cytidylyltransferase